MPHYSGPLLTADLLQVLRRAQAAGVNDVVASLDLGRSTHSVALRSRGFQLGDQEFDWPPTLKPRTVYFYAGSAWHPLQRFAGSLIKLVPTEWGAPTFEIDGIKMLPTAQTSPIADAERKVALVRPAGKTLLDTCGGLGYFAAAALQAGVARVQSHEKNPDVIWLREHNPWSPDLALCEGRLQVLQVDIAEHIVTLEDESFDAALHDPPRFGIAGELYSQAFYDQLARVLRPMGMLFHYTGSPNKKTSGRNVPAEVSRRLQAAGFSTRLELDGVWAQKQSARRRS